jgi:hypothetical protein
MALFHEHGNDKRESENAADPKDAASFEILAANGKVMRYARDDFDEIFETADPDEVQRQVAHGWAILAQREVTSGARGPSGDDLIVGIEGLRVGGVLGYTEGTTVTWYTLGFLKELAQGQPVEQ